MTKKKRSMRLGLILAISTVFSFAVAGAAFFALNQLGNYILKEEIFTEERIAEISMELMQEFSSYVEENTLYITDSNAIQTWVDGKQDIILLIYSSSNRRLGLATSYFIYSNMGGVEVSYSFLHDTDKRYINEYYVSFYDSGYPFSTSYRQQHLVQCLYYPQLRWETILTGAEMALSFLLFTALLLLLIRKKTSYIGLLSREVTAMQGGDFGHPITIKGRDEITSLARDIDDMRLSFRERLESESAMRQANTDLVTTMSHDLRTPLTALIGYLDIIDLHKYTTQEELSRYIHSSAQRARQIKEMSDKLFEYALLYSGREEELVLESFDAATILGQFVDEGLMMLESQGFTVTVSPLEASAEIRLNVGEMHRVFDNLFSNIRKYGDARTPVSVTMQALAGEVMLRVTNAVGGDARYAESAGIGLKMCEKTMQKHGGRFVHESRGAEYTCALYFVVEK